MDELAERLPRALSGRLDRARAELGQAGARCGPTCSRPLHRRGKDRLDALWRVAQLAHPNRPLDRGYARMSDREGNTLISAAAAREARLLSLHFGDGAVDAAVGDAPVERPRKAAYSKPRTDQPKLL